LLLLLLFLLLPLLLLLQPLLMALLRQLQQHRQQLLLPWHPTQLLRVSLTGFPSLHVSCRQLLVLNAGLCVSDVGLGRQLMLLHLTIGCNCVRYCRCSCRLR
jgi:apolipoprotein N-acyltransferase